MCSNNPKLQSVVHIFTSTRKTAAMRPSGNAFRASLAQRFGHEVPNDVRCKRCRTGGPFESCKITVTTAGKIWFGGLWAGCHSGSDSSRCSFREPRIDQLSSHILTFMAGKNAPEWVRSNFRKLLSVEEIPPYLKLATPSLRAISTTSISTPRLSETICYRNGQAAR